MFCIFTTLVSGVDQRSSGLFMNWGIYFPCQSIDFRQRQSLNPYRSVQTGTFNCTRYCMAWTPRSHSTRSVSSPLTPDATHGTIPCPQLTILNGAAIPGRILPNLLAQRYGQMNVFTASAFLCAILAWAFFGAKSVAGVVVFSVIYGFFVGACTCRFHLIFPPPR